VVGSTTLPVLAQPSTATHCLFRPGGDSGLTRGLRGYRIDPGVLEVTQWLFTRVWSHTCWPNPPMRGSACATGAGRSAGGHFEFWAWAQRCAALPLAAQHCGGAERALEGAPPR